MTDTEPQVVVDWPRDLPRLSSSASFTGCAPTIPVTPPNSRFVPIEREVPVKNELSRKQSLVSPVRLVAMKDFHQVFAPSWMTRHYIGTHYINTILGYNSCLL